MKPNYQREGVTLYLADCWDVLPDMPVADNAAVVTDPPYGSGLYATDVADACSAVRVSWLCERWPVALFGWPERLINFAIAMQRRPDEWITWWPTNAACRGFNLNGLWRETECVAIWGTHRCETIRVPRNAEGARLARMNYDSHSGRLHCAERSVMRRASDIWTDSSPNLGFNKKGRAHPNEKPTSVMARLVCGMTAVGDCVIDPFMGSGTTGVACVQMGRAFIGIEINATYFDTARRRIDAAFDCLKPDAATVGQSSLWSTPA